MAGGVSGESGVEICSEAGQHQSRYSAMNFDASTRELSDQAA